MKRVLICAAIPRELKYVQRILASLEGARKTAEGVFFVQRGSTEIILHLTGIGIKSAESSVYSLLNELHPDFMMSLGFGGAIYEGPAAGDLIWAPRFLLLRSNPSRKDAAEISDISLPEAMIPADRLSSSIHLREGCIVTLQEIMTKPEIRNILQEGISFPVCDMETFVLARAAVQRQIPFFAARAISDTADEDIPREFFDITDEAGKIAYRRLGMSILRKPALLKSLIRLGMNSEKAAKSLGDLVRSFLETGFGQGAAR